MHFACQLLPMDDVLYKSCDVSWLATVMECAGEIRRVGKKGIGVLKTDHRVTVALLSIGYKFIECLKVGP